MEHPVPPPPDSVVLRRGALSVLLPRRASLAALGLGVLAALAVVGSTLVGAGHLTPGQALNALFGEGGHNAVLLVQKFRLPRVVAGLLAGAALGLAGCLTQTLSRNRLATPDLLGVTDGATVAILVAVAGSTAGMIGDWWLGPVGAVVAGALVMLAAGGADSRGYRVLVVGLALTATVRAITDLVLTQQGLHTASAIFTWTIGSLNARGYEIAVPVGVALAVLLPLAVLAGRQLSVLRFDDDVAATLGTDLRRARMYVLAMAVLLAGLAVGVGGPIAFVAMAAPIVAGRLAGPARVPLVGSALVGGVLVVLADTLARIATEHELPVGVVTNVLGGPFLLWVLLSDKSNRRF
ncbi:FecCD family ABC transporter permease [Streptoalloteichus hindustanus]|uniref:Iron complex transport system permease protein n=1 Tax=Streptoalloteichus hindustanus TaxID=2017 RepID=A0A1M5JRA1_STRHI|nr:iron ABC transporter permease [Streptoalloteichus hindustanus]SHG43074.1 iron complex transport system permease protein [Streptoalloteichus hindustanus]